MEHRKVLCPSCGELQEVSCTCRMCGRDIKQFIKIDEKKKINKKTTKKHDKR